LRPGGISKSILCVNAPVCPSTFAASDCVKIWGSGTVGCVPLKSAKTAPTGTSRIETDKITETNFEWTDPCPKRDITSRLFFHEHVHNITISSSPISSCAYLRAYPHTSQPHGILLCMRSRFGIRSLRKPFPSEDACLHYIFTRRHAKQCSWGGSFKRIKGRRLYHCSRCSRQIAPTAGTIFEKSKVPLSLWFHTILVFSNAKCGISARVIECV
jgi:hypothetical protein